MSVPELRLKDRTEGKTLSDLIIGGGTAVKHAFHRFEIDEATYLQVQTLVLHVDKLQTLMESLKPQPSKVKEDYVQPLLDFAMTLNEKGEETAATALLVPEEQTIVDDLEPQVYGEVHD